MTGRTRRLAEGVRLRTFLGNPGKAVPGLCF
jgi:hypothetical protein